MEYRGVKVNYLKFKLNYLCLRPTVKIMLYEIILNTYFNRVRILSYACTLENPLELNSINSLVSKFWRELAVYVGAHGVHGVLLEQWLKQKIRNRIVMRLLPRVAWLLSYDSQVRLMMNSWVIKFRAIWPFPLPLPIPWDKITKADRIKETSGTFWDFIKRNWEFFPPFHWTGQTVNKRLQFW